MSEDERDTVREEILEAEIGKLNKILEDYRARSHRDERKIANLKGIINRSNLVHRREIEAIENAHTNEVIQRAALVNSVIDDVRALLRETVVELKSKDTRLARSDDFQWRFNNDRPFYDWVNRFVAHELWRAKGQ